MDVVGFNLLFIVIYCLLLISSSISCVAWSFGVQVVVFFYSSVSVVLFDILEILQVSLYVVTGRDLISDSSYVFSVICLSLVFIH